MSQEKTTLEIIAPSTEEAVAKGLEQLGLTKDMVEIAQAFAGVNYNRIIFSKLDETNEMESLFALASEINVPISYLTTGQNVPDDIEIASEERLFRLANKELRHA